MPKTTAPLLSFDSRGQIAKTMVYSSWKGRSYVRRYTVPTYTNSNEQVLTRNTFSWLQAVYKLAPAGFSDAWEAYAKGKVLTARNGFTKFNLPVLRPETDVQLMAFSPGNLGGLAPASVVATPGNNQLSVAVTAPTLFPAGWTITRAIAAAIVDQDPQSDASYQMVIGEDLTSTYTIVLTGLLEVPYVVGAWLEWSRDDGKAAYSPSMNTTGTPT